MKSVKKTYQKPLLKTIKLIPEEAVLGGCKNDLGAGPTQNQRMIPQWSNNGS